ncbi:hypothetical protein ANN_07888 [Periplaneta americana]|uniref:Uncharacterized protein n=1 Tax=Periplaneta americana TaxID=6978 RepID=A0ABQ8T1E7_PERAM|nr:hypothetical protein ANN_07888 [Periplaneta americana]
MSPIEHVWDMVGRQLVRHGPPAPTLDTLWSLIQTAWREIPQEHIQALSDSMPRRLEALITAERWLHTILKSHGYRSVDVRYISIQSSETNSHVETTVHHNKLSRKHKGSPSESLRTAAVSPGILHRGAQKATNKLHLRAYHGYSIQELKNPDKHRHFVYCRCLQSFVEHRIAPPFAPGNSGFIGKGQQGGGVKLKRKASETRLAAPGEEVASSYSPCLWFRSGSTRGGSDFTNDCVHVIESEI